MYFLSPILTLYLGISDTNMGPVNSQGYLKTSPVKVGVHGAC